MPGGVKSGYVAPGLRGRMNATMRFVLWGSMPLAAWTLRRPVPGEPSDAGYAFGA
jgi:hypothetical protein